MAHAEVDQPHGVAPRPPAVQEDVLGLQVVVRDPARVQMLDGAQHAGGHAQRRPGGEGTGLDHLAQGAPGTKGKMS